MEPEISVHDNLLYAYSVNCEARRITLHTVYHHVEPHEFTDVAFNEVIAHHFEHVLPGNIIFDVTEDDIERVVFENASLFSISHKWGWPPLKYHGDLRQLIADLKSLNILAFSIGSSYGLSGWVFARTCTRIRRKEAAPIP